MNFKVGDKVTWIKDKNVSGKIVSINDFRPPEMECAVDFGFSDVVFCSREELILDESATKQESVICKECDQTFTKLDEIIVFNGIAWHKDCLDKFPTIYGYSEKVEDGEFIDTDDIADLMSAYVRELFTVEGEA
ncbi:hypothetical protein NU360_04215 [Listeria monocytogenes]|uniref:hypothetical protein n=1 Tax=Listeria monocytogenes TaxID=1639 RepID=UPI00215128D5|nr:hypothetical protein [Listeria monocytogenes]MCR6303341.1 hypothetical protein [Listeria monocytogenes]MCR6313504.1 hypothetical protein [Listeria monocytogenes]MCR6315419.1 hypothetical protein [Listeria monocytogenes]MCR6319418.1 hypothetical protein [Listeria monocytogenes]MCR6326998.1 hypothetical protein [Listeria monocytogenes]